MASEQTNTSTSTLSRAVSALEAAGGEKLIHRSARQFQLTTAGQNYYQRFAPLFKNVDTQWDEVNRATTELTGDIHIACPMAFVDFFLQARALEFMTSYPSVNIIIHHAQNTQHFIDAQMDLAITNTVIQKPTLMQKMLFEVPLGFAASPSYLRANGVPETVLELERFDLLSGSTCTPFWYAEQNGQSHKIPVKPRYQVDNINHIHTAALAGLGICLMPLPILNNYVQSGKLVHILKEVICPPNKTYLVWSDKQLIASRVKAFRDLIIERIDLGIHEHFWISYNNQHQR